MDRANTLGPEHLSLYALTLERSIPLRGTLNGAIADPDPDLAAEMFYMRRGVVGKIGRGVTGTLRYRTNGQTWEGMPSQPGYLCCVMSLHRHRGGGAFVSREVAGFGKRRTRVGTWIRWEN